MRFLYAQLSQCAHSKDSVFVRTPSGKHTLKDGISFHLYVSTAPCGDARTFGMGDDAHTNRASRGRARVKIEAGEGAVYPPKEIQTWDGLTRATNPTRLCTMSCSDKLARWNILGVQGSLLSVYTDPIYFASITVGGKFSEHLQRAVYTRIEMIGDLPGPYKVNRPSLYDISVADHATPKKSPQSSLNWCDDKDGSVEMVDCQTGRQSNKVAISRLCKHSLFQSFLELWDKLAPEDYKGITAQNLQECCSYGQVKSLAGDYQVAKTRLFEHYRVHCGSRWIKKPPQQDDFLI